MRGFIGFWVTLCCKGTGGGEGGILRDSVFVVGVDEQLSPDTEAATLGVLADLQVLQETIVNELSLHCRGGGGRKESVYWRQGRGVGREGVKERVK